MSLPKLIQVANPGSTLGEAVGALVEREVNRLIRPIAEDNGCVYVSAGRQNPRTGKATKLLLKDSSDNEFQVDSVIANARMQPLVLIESKYIRYKKHNRDKGSWICTAHYGLRRSFPTVRQSIAVLAGSWSATSKAMMRSFDTTLFEVGFPKIVSTLAEYGIEFDWGEKERDKAMKAWHIWEKLSDSDYTDIAAKLLEDIEPELRETLRVTLDTSIPREIREIEVSLETNLGETRRYIFQTIEGAIDFLESLDVEAVLNDENGPVLWNIDTMEDQNND